MDVPETQYTKTPDGAYLAYQTVGEGPMDIVYGQYLGGMELIWDDPAHAHSLRRFAEMGRLVCFEARGWGSSDALPLDVLPTPEGWMDDVRIILDAIGSTSASFVCHAAAGFIGMLFAATYPERTGALVLVDAYARAAWADDYPIGFPEDVREAVVERSQRGFGKGGFARFLAPSRSDDERFRRLIARWERISWTPSAAAAAMRWTLELDVRSVLPAIRVPTLVMHHRDGRVYPVAFSEYLAEHIPNARFKLLPGSDVYLFSDAADDVIDQIEEFITGVPPVREPDRTLATVLFTDIVASTEHASRLGDRKWSRVLDEHDALITRELERYRGQRVNPTGDGVLATFDGPARAIRCAQSIVRGVRPLGIGIRAGLHTGEIELRGEDIGGIAVHIANRVQGLAGPGEVLVSRTVVDLVSGSGIEFEERGDYELKGVPGRWTVYTVAE